MKTVEEKITELAARIVRLSTQDMQWEDGNFWTGPQLRDYLAEDAIEKIATQYRESEKLKAFMRTYLKQVGEAYEASLRMLDHFDLDTAVGDQLTILGKVLGWPRCHCKGQLRPVFGFACEDECEVPDRPIGGFCEAEWDCGGPEYIEFCFSDDELYRRFLKARALTLLGDYSRDGVVDASRLLFGEIATVLDEGPGRVSIVTGRLLSQTEIAIAHLFRQVMPIAPGVRFELWHSNGPAFGFGEGWGGFCTGAFPAQIPLNL